MKKYFIRRGWKDLIFLCLAAATWFGIRWYFAQPDDYARWKARIPIDPNIPLSKGHGTSGSPPCLYIVPPKATGQTHTSGTIDDCATLLPNGQRLDFFEVALGGGFFPVKTDLYVSGSVPLAFTRTYAPLTSAADRFQIYLPHVYDLFVFGSRFPYTYLYWVFPDSRQVYYNRVSQGTGYADAVFAPNSAKGVFANSRVNWNGWGWDWSFADGMTYLSPEAYNAKRPQQGSIIGVFNSRGEEAKLSRDDDGTLTRIDSPNGGWIRFYYSDAHLLRARSSLKETVDYAYDPRDHVTSVHEPNGSTITYSYDDADRITKADDPSEGVSVSVEYDDKGAVSTLTVNGMTYRFANDAADNSVTVTAPLGKVTRVNIKKTDDYTSYSIQ